jgi:NAD-dependent deacetylase
MSIAKVTAMLSSAERIAVLSGAGLSKASGIPTYRDKGGLWTQEGMARYSSAEELEWNPEGFREFWGARLLELSKAEANAGHFALAELQRRKREVVLITQNVDGLLTKAGAANVLELHGSLLRNRCTECATVFPALMDAKASESTCPSCGAGKMRPDVVLFGEFLDERISSDASRAAEVADVFLLAGTSAVVHPAADLASLAVERGAELVIVNLEATPLDELATVIIRGRTEEVLPSILAAMRHSI